MKPLALLLLLISFTASAQHLGVSASFRGLSVVDNNVAWLGGNNGWVCHTINGGVDWINRKVVGYEQSDFRSIYAFDAKTVVIANAGSPAYILRTTDSGATWKVVYTNNDKAAFIDGIAFWNDKEGIAYGDPINGRMLLLRTKDGGLTWTESPESQRPKLEPGEASFAASGTTIRCTGPGEVVIATGGMVSRLWSSKDGGVTWTVRNTPIEQGDSSAGIFSIAFNGSHGIMVGGDYKRMNVAVDHAFFTEDGITWKPPVTATGGYRECVEYITGNIAIATGPLGTDITHDGGKNWEPMSINGFHAVRKARTGSLLILAGAEGSVTILSVIDQ